MNYVRRPLHTHVEPDKVDAIANGDASRPNMWSWTGIFSKTECANSQPQSLENLSFSKRKRKRKGGEECLDNDNDDSTKGGSVHNESRPGIFPPLPTKTIKYEGMAGGTKSVSGSKNGLNPELISNCGHNVTQQIWQNKARYPTMNITQDTQDIFSDIQWCYRQKGRIRPNVYIIHFNNEQADSGINLMGEIRNCKLFNDTCLHIHNKNMYALDISSNPDIRGKVPIYVIICNLRVDNELINYIKIIAFENKTYGTVVVNINDEDDWCQLQGGIPKYVKLYSHNNLLDQSNNICMITPPGEKENKTNSNRLETLISDFKTETLLKLDNIAAQWKRDMSPFFRTTVPHADKEVMCDIVDMRNVENHLCVKDVKDKQVMCDLTPYMDSTFV